MGPSLVATSLFNFGPIDFRQVSNLPTDQLIALALAVLASAPQQQHPLQLLGLLALISAATVAGYPIATIS